MKLSQRRTKSKLRKKVAEINVTITAKPRAHPQPLTKTSAKFHNKRLKLFDELRSKDTQCIYFGRLTKSKTKNNVRITAKPRAHLPTLTKHLKSFKRKRLKLKVGLSSQDTQCLYALVEVESKNDQVQTAIKLTKLI